MPTSERAIRPARGQAAGWALLLMLASLAGCGGGARPASPPRVNPTVTEPSPPPPEVARAEGRVAGPEEAPAKPPVVETEWIRLPGQDRLLPSEDPRNRPAGADSMGLLASAAGSALSSGAPQDPPMDTAPSGDSPERSDALAVEEAPEGGDAPAARETLAAKRGKSGGSSYVVQVFATRATSRAHAIRDELERALGIPVFVEDEGGIWKVRLGQEAERSAAEKLRRRLKAMGYEDAFIIRRRSR